MQPPMAIRQIIGKRIAFDCTETIDSAFLRLCDSQKLFGQTKNSSDRQSDFPSLVDEARD
jgi:hypothetical protein